MKLVRTSSAPAVERLLAAAQVAQPTYEQVGATLAGDLPDGFHHVRLDVELGPGAEVFERAVLGLKAWKEQALPFLAVHPPGAPVTEGETILITMGPRFLSVAIPCRIVATVEESDRWGFAYGTLPGHLEQGEECFMLTRGADDTVRFEISSFTLPADTMMRLLGPLGRVGQRIVVCGYLRALKKFVDAA